MKMLCSLEPVRQRRIVPQFEGLSVEEIGGFRLSEEDLEFDCRW
jgi:hypothetical protein